MIKTSGLLSAEELSRVLGIREKTVKKLAKGGELPCEYEGRRLVFNVEALCKYFREMERRAA